MDTSITNQYPSADEAISDIEVLRSLPEGTLEQIVEKKRQVNAFINTCTKLRGSIHSDQGENAEQNEQAQDTQADDVKFGEIAEALRFARTELERLGDKEELLLSATN